MAAGFYLLVFEKDGFVGLIFYLGDVAEGNCREAVTQIVSLGEGAWMVARGCCCGGAIEKITCLARFAGVAD